MASKAQVSKQSLIRLEHHKGKRIVARFQGGKEISGVLMSYDGGINLVLGEAVELASPSCPEKRNLGVVIVRGSLVLVV